MWRVVIGVLVLTGCVTQSPAPSSPGSEAAPSGSAIQGLEAADSSQPAAGVCGGPETGLVASFAIAIDTPNPRCAFVLPDQRLRVTNETPQDVTVTLHGIAYVVTPGAELTFTPTFGSIWEPGVHVLHTSMYGGGGPEIWLVSR